MVHPADLLAESRGQLQTLDDRVIAFLVSQPDVTARLLAELLANRGKDAENRWIGFDQVKADLKERFGAGGTGIEDPAPEVRPR